MPIADVIPEESLPAVSNITFIKPIFKLENTHTINEEGNRIYLVDATGEYSLTNLGGYGLPNASRSDVALVVLGLLKTAKGDVLVSFEAYDPLSTSKFNAIISQDGWYTFNLLNIPIYNPTNLVNYTPGEILYDTTFYKPIRIVDTLVVGSQPPQFNRTIVDVPLVDLKNSSYTVSTVESFFIANNSKVKLLLNTKISNLIYDGADFADKRLIRYKENYNLVRAILQGALYEFCRGNKFVAQRDIEFLNNNNYVRE